MIGQGGQRGAARRYAVVARQRLIDGGVLCLSVHVKSLPMFGNGSS